MEKQMNQTEVEVEVGDSIVSKYSPNNDPNDFFCLRVSDNVAEPKFMPGDILIVKKSCALDYDGQLLVVAVNGRYLLRKVSYDHDEDIFLLKDYYGIFSTDLVTDEDGFEILGYPVGLQRDLEPEDRKEQNNE